MTPGFFYMISILAICMGALNNPSVAITEISEDVTEPLDLSLLTQIYTTVYVDELFYNRVGASLS